MTKQDLPNTLTKDEKHFCELYVLGCEPYIGNAKKCYEDVFSASGTKAKMYAKEMLSREDISSYVNYLRKIGNYETEELRGRLTEKLLHIIDETSSADYIDRFGTPLSPAPLRSVSVQAIKALMDMYPLKVAQESKLEVNGNGEGGIIFNVIAPQSVKTEE